MHGRPRPPLNEPEDSERKKASQKRLALFSRLCNEVLERRAAKKYDAESMMLAAKLLEQNPEVYSVWNYRREALAGVLKGEEGSDAAGKATEFELKLSETALRKNPKSYAAWHHRKWLVCEDLVPLDKELLLLTKLQELDSRNFFAWAYRRFITAKLGTTAQQEEQYTMGLINANFSDYSAWHARTVLLPQMHDAEAASAQQQGSAPAAVGTAEASGTMPGPAIGQELDLVEQATFTDPSDQSAWIYHRWLLSQALQRYNGAQDSEPQQQHAAHHVLSELLDKEIGRCEALLEAEGDRSKCKWPILTMARLLELQASLHAGGEGAASDEERGSGESKSELKELYTELIQIDPMRKGYYEDALAGKAAVLVRPGR